MTDTWSEEIGFSLNGKYEFLNEDGVYVIAEINDGISNVRYVGSGNLFDRITAHRSDNESNNCLKNVMSDTDNVKIKSIVIGNDEDRANTEYTCYKHYLDNGHNLCNKIAPYGKFVTGMTVPF